MLLPGTHAISGFVKGFVEDFVSKLHCSIHMRAREEKLREILPQEKIKNKKCSTQGRFIVTGWFTRCLKCGKFYEFQGYDKDSLKFFQRVSIFPVQKVYRFYSGNRNAVNEMCSQCGRARALE